MGDSNVRSIMNLGNSIVGVSILAMPYCFSKCGMVLGALLLMFCTLLTQWTCKMLMKAAVMTRNQTYENLALGVLGPTGKYLTGLSVIGLNLGTCIAFFVIIGDLAPPIIAQATGVHWSATFLRAVVLILAAVIVVFPLGLLRSVDSLSGISLASLIFYAALACQLIIGCLGTVSRGWWNNVSLWDNSGLLKCIPIFALAFSCQTQLFIIYSALQDSGFRRISDVINGATISVATLYFLVALFGYLSFYSVGVKGDVLANFDLGFFSQLSRCGFSLSVMVSFPLMIFPCRVSINSLFFSSKSNELHVLEPIPQRRFVAITTFIIVSTLAVAILIPNVETVLSLTGATMGNLIAFIIPSVIFLKVAGWNSEYSTRAKLCALLGFSVMILSTTTIIQTEMNSIGNTEINKPLPMQPVVIEHNAKPEIPELVRNNDQHLDRGGKENGQENVKGVKDKEVVDVNKGKPDARKPEMPVGNDRGGGGKDAVPGRPDGNGRQQLPEEMRDLDERREKNRDIKQPQEPNKDIGQKLEADGKVEKDVVQVPSTDKVRVGAVEGGELREVAADQKNVEGNQAGADHLLLHEDKEQRLDQNLPSHQEPEARGHDSRNVDSEVKKGVLEQPARVKNPGAVDGRAGEDNNEVHNQLREDVSKLNDRLRKLEKENQNLKQRQEAIEGIQVENLLDGDSKLAGDMHQGGVAVDRPVLNPEANKGGAGAMHNEVVGGRSILEAGSENKHDVKRRDVHKGDPKSLHDHQELETEERKPEKPTEQSDKVKVVAVASARTELSQIQDTNKDSDIPVGKDSKLNETITDVFEDVTKPLNEALNNEGQRRKAGQRDLKTIL